MNVLYSRNPNPFVFITKGLPASGKTTWAKNTQQANPPIRRINNDDIRDSLTNRAYSRGTYKWNGAFEKKVTAAFYDCLALGILHKETIICDNTYLNPKTLKRLTDYLDQHKVAFQIVDFTNVSVNECLRRDQMRKKSGQRCVGDNVILKMWSDHVLPNIKRYTANVNENHRCIIVDLDGTLAELNGRNPYDASNCHITDTPNPAVHEVITYMCKVRKIFFFSGRTDEYKPQTLEFLASKVGMFPDAPGTTNCQLFMRKTGDVRSDDIVKKEMFDEHIRGKYHVSFVIDDRPKVIRMWKEQGLIVFNVGDGVEF